MRIHLSILAIALASSTLAAQTTYQQWTLWSGATNFTSRGSLGTGVGEIFQGVHASTNVGVLDVNGKCEIGQMYSVQQDQNSRTLETWTYMIRGGADATGPASTKAAILGQAGPFNMPVVTTGGVVRAWGFTNTLAATARITVPCEKHWDFGVAYGPSPNWTMDGASSHMTRGDRTTGPNNSDPSMLAHSKAEDHAWQLVGTSTLATHPSLKRTWRWGVRVADGVTMNLGAGTRFGMGGSFPVAAPATPLVGRLQGGNSAAGAVPVIALGTTRFPGGLGAFPGGAKLYVLGPYSLFFGPAASGSGVGNVQILPFLPPAASGAGRFEMQGALGLITSGQPKLANGQTIVP